MIEKEYGKFNLECDDCGMYIPQLVTFQDAINYEGWTKRNVNGEWENYCEDCSDNK